MLKLPDDPAAVFKDRGLAHKKSDVIALLQAIKLSEVAGSALPEWASTPVTQLIFDIVLQKRGSVGRGNVTFGVMQKAFIRTVRASAFFAVRAWQNDPRCFADLPTKVIERWFDGTIAWDEFRDATQAQRPASIGLAGFKPYAGSGAIIRKAAYGMPKAVPWGRSDVEGDLGLRGHSCIFGRPSIPMPKEIKTLLEMFEQKAKSSK